MGENLIGRQAAKAVLEEMIRANEKKNKIYSKMIKEINWDDLSSEVEGELWLMLIRKRTEK